MTLTGHPVNGKGAGFFLIPPLGHWMCIIRNGRVKFVYFVYIDGSGSFQEKQSKRRLGKAQLPTLTAPGIHRIIEMLSDD